MFVRGVLTFVWATGWNTENDRHRIADSPRSGSDGLWQRISRPAYLAGRASDYESGGQEFETLRARQHPIELAEFSDRLWVVASTQIWCGSNMEARPAKFLLIAPPLKRVTASPFARSSRHISASPCYPVPICCEAKNSATSTKLARNRRSRDLGAEVTSYVLRRPISAFSFPNYGVSNRGRPPRAGASWLARSHPAGRKRIGSKAHAWATGRPALIRGSGRLQEPR